MEFQFQGTLDFQFVQPLRAPNYTTTPTPYIQGPYSYIYGVHVFSIEFQFQDKLD